MKERRNQTKKRKENNWHKRKGKRERTSKERNLECNFFGNFFEKSLRRCVYC